jgi:hypothetical protein
VETPYGVLVPIYEEDERERRKFTKSLTFSENGYLESISLQEPTEVLTKLGSISAEHLTFYEGGNIKRIFPLDGKITAYWSEEDEYNLAQEIELKGSFGTIKKKFLGLYFYEDGAIKSLTLWMRDSVLVQTSVGPIETRIGLSFYENGEINSLEPKKPTLVDTPIGKITAFNQSANGIHRDSNSLCFYQDGKIKSLLTSTDRITLTDKQGFPLTLEPSLKENRFNVDALDIVPLLVEFYEDKVRFKNNAKNEYNLGETTFSIKHLPLSVVEDACSSCTGACESQK